MVDSVSDHWCTKIMAKSVIRAFKCRKGISPSFAELSDWDQRMICLHELNRKERGLAEDIPRLRNISKQVRIVGPP